jgi:hypothetical protein
MLVGAEVIGTQLTDGERRTLAAIRPDVVKVRRPLVVSEVLDVLPDARIIARADGEGYDQGDMLGSYDHWRDVLIRYRDSILTYVFANEVNHNSRNVDPAWWLAQAEGFLERCTAPVPLCLPGLQPLWRTDEWLPVLETLRATKRFSYCGVHVYWTTDGPENAAARILDGYGFVPPHQQIVLEANGGHADATYQPSSEDRAAETATAARIAAERGLQGFVVFSLGGPGWEQFTLSDDGFRQVFAVGRRTPARPKRTRAPKPIPVEAVVMTLDDLQKQSYLTTLPDKTVEDVNLSTGLADFWLKNKATLGTPVAGEEILDDGRVAQRFATGRITVYDPTTNLIEIV